MYQFVAVLVTFSRSTAKIIHILEEQQQRLKKEQRLQSATIEEDPSDRRILSEELLVKHWKMAEDIVKELTRMDDSLGIDGQSALDLHAQAQCIRPEVRRRFEESDAEGKKQILWELFQRVMDSRESGGRPLDMSDYHTGIREIRALTILDSMKEHCASFMTAVEDLKRAFPGIDDEEEVYRNRFKGDSRIVRRRYAVVTHID